MFNLPRIPANPGNNHPGNNNQTWHQPVAFHRPVSHISVSGKTPPRPPPPAQVKELRCGLCDARFRSPAQLSAHREQVHGKRWRFTCGLCGKGFNVKELYEDHSNMHLNIKAHRCPYCPSQFTYKSNMYHHISGKHRTNAAPAANSTSSPVAVSVNTTSAGAFHPKVERQHFF